MSEPNILYKTEDTLARITLNAPEQRNALTYTMVQELIVALRRAEEDRAVRAVLLVAAGDNFSAGGNLREFAAEIDDPAIRHWESGAS